MFGGDDEEGDFLSPTGGAKLACLFGLDQEASQGNESFQYTAPKQPRKISNPATQKQAPPTGFYFNILNINGQYVKQGKLGAAVLGNHTTKEYKLLLYLSQQKQVTTARIHMGFVFTVQPNNYCTFYDDQRQNWSLMFESEKALSNFCKEVCLAKANSTASLDTVVVQDLTLGEGQGVENGDSLEVVYTGWLLQNHSIGQMFDSNQNKEKLLRLKIGAGKVIKGWEEGMLGMKKAGSRLIIIPPNLAYGSKGVPNCIPANSTLIFEAELRRVKFSKDSGSDRASASSRDSAAPSPAPSPAPSVENLAPEPAVQTTASGPGRTGDPPLRAKSNSLSEQLANPDATKAKLISRMAKMGQPMLPFLTGVASQPESSDSELEYSLHCTCEFPKLFLSTVNPYPLITPPSALLPVITTIAPQPGLPGSSHAFQVSLYNIISSSDVTSFMMTEARQHNTEIRLAVGKVADKVDQLASKIDNLQRQGSISIGASSMSMETSMIVHNIQRIVQENECLKKEVFDKSSRIEEQNRKIGELINQNQRYMEQSNLLLEQRNDSIKSSSEQSQARLLQAEQDKVISSALITPILLCLLQVRLTEDLASSTARLSQLQLEALAHQQKAVELQSKLNSVLQDSESQCKQISALETQLHELKEAAESTQAQYRIEKQRRKDLELRINNMEEELQDLKTDKEGLERTILERKKKWQAERQHRDEEVEELRKSSQQELDNLRAELRKTRTSTNTAASEQLQAELEEEMKGKCERMLASAKEQHSRELVEITEQRDALQGKLTQLQEKVDNIAVCSHKYTKHRVIVCFFSVFLFFFKYTALEQQEAAVREKLERRVAELQIKQPDHSGETVAEVKRVMNGVFHSLRGEFDLSESYTGHDVLGVIVTTIKNVTLHLLSGTNKSSVSKKEEETEEEDKEESDVEPTEKKLYHNVHENGEREVKEEEQGEHVVEVASQDISETQANQEVAEKDTKTVSESETQGPAESLLATDVHPVSLTELKPQETAEECEEQQEQGKTAAEHNDNLKSAFPNEDDPDNDETMSEPNADLSSKAGKEIVDDGEHVEETFGDAQKAFGPPTNPPPPPNALQNSPKDDTR
uniref:peptidylprolyl isomerase n=1 Tax=Anabas testudineus TaxID=64144 RepID=A0A7N6AIL4_ANATE